jgi:hypothetical protein
MLCSTNVKGAKCSHGEFIHHDRQTSFGCNWNPGLPTATNVELAATSVRSHLAHQQPWTRDCTVGQSKVHSLLGYSSQRWVFHLRCMMWLLVLLQLLLHKESSQLILGIVFLNGFLEIIVTHCFWNSWRNYVVAWRTEVWAATNVALNSAYMHSK